MKGFHMLPYEDNHMGRRDFILGTLLLPFLASTLVTDLKIAGDSLLSTETKDDFVVLGGWVFLKSDLIGNPG
jgi:hypothetical protein